MNLHHRVLLVVAMITVALSVPASQAAELVAHYEFEDANDLGKDSSGKGNHADDVIEVEQVEGVFGQAAYFDETLSSSFVKFDGLDGFTSKPGVTLAAWVSLDAATTGFDGIISQDGGGCCEHRILLHPNQQPFINLSEHSDRHLTQAPFFEFDEWTHIAMTGLDDEAGGFAEARVYVNGEEVDDSPQEFPIMDDATDWNTYLGAGEAGNVHLLTGALDDVRIYEGALTEDEIRAIMEGGGGTGLQAGDADQDLDFDQLDLVKVQVAAKYLSGTPATWGEGDWDGAPGGSQGNPPAGDGEFSQLDIIAALSPGHYLTGPYAALTPGGTRGDGQTSLVYNSGTGEVSVDSPADKDLTSINITSAGNMFVGDKPAALDGAFDNFAADNIFKATFGGSFGDISFGAVLPTGLTADAVAADLSAVGSLAGGGDLGDVDLVYIPEPAAFLLGTIAAFGLLGTRRRRRS